MMLAVKDIARLLDIHDSTARRWGDNGIIQTFRINSRGDRRFISDDVYRLRHELKTL